MTQINFISADIPPASVRLDTATRTFQLAQPDNTQTTVIVAQEEWQDDSGNPFRTIAFLGLDASSIQLSGGFFYFFGIPIGLHIDRITPYARAGTYNLAETATDTYSGAGSSGNQATVTILDLENRTIQVAEQGYATQTYTVPADDWFIEDLGVFESTTYLIADGDLTIDGGFLVSEDGTPGFGWLQTRQGQQLVDNYDQVAFSNVAQWAFTVHPPAVDIVVGLQAVQVNPVMPSIAAEAMLPGIAFSSQVPRVDIDLRTDGYIPKILNCTINANIPATTIDIKMPKIKMASTLPSFAVEPAIPSITLLSKLPNILIERSA